MLLCRFWVLAADSPEKDSWKLGQFNATRKYRLKPLPEMVESNSSRYSNRAEPTPASTQLVIALNLSASCWGTYECRRRRLRHAGTRRLSTNAVELRLVKLSCIWFKNASVSSFDDACSPSTHVFSQIEK